MISDGNWSATFRQLSVQFEAAVRKLGNPIFLFPFVHMVVAALPRPSMSHKNRTSTGKRDKKVFYIFLFDVLNEFATPRHIELSVRNIRPFSVVMHSDSFGNLAIPGRRLYPSTPIASYPAFRKNSIEWPRLRRMNRQTFRVLGK